MAEKTVAAPETSSVASPREETRTPERHISPPVDIYELPEGLVVMADLPGVSEERLQVRVDHHILTIRGNAQHHAVGHTRHREYELVNFFRQFELSDAVDESGITAELKHGVLTVQLPKTAALRPRKIDVKVD